MRTYPLFDQSGAMFAFEVDNGAMSPRELRRLVRSALGAQVTFQPRGFLAREDTRLRFVHLGVEFEVFEPFGDNSRYWIGPAGDQPKRVAAVDEVHGMLDAYNPSIGRRILSVLGL